MNTKIKADQNLIMTFYNGCIEYKKTQGEIAAGNTVPSSLKKGTNLHMTSWRTRISWFLKQFKVQNTNKFTDM